jgi:hypothetical protein
MDDETNFLEETIKALKENGKSPEDVKWIGNEEGWIDWGTFEMFANFKYDSGYGGQEIKETLTVVGDDWWLERHEYGGSEWWAFKTFPIKPVNNLSRFGLKRYED